MWKQAGLLLPLYLGVIAGFTEQADPFCRWLDGFPRAAAVARDLSLGVYLLTEPMKGLMQLIRICPGSEEECHQLSLKGVAMYVVFLLLLHLLSACVHYLLQLPLVQCYANAAVGQRLLLRACRKPLQLHSARAA